MTDLGSNSAYSSLFFQHIFSIEVNESLPLFCSYRSRYTSSKNFSDRLAFASESVLRLGTFSMPMWRNFLTSAVMAASISRRESKRMITAKSIVRRCVYPSKLFTYFSPPFLRLISVILARSSYFISCPYTVCPKKCVLLPTIILVLCLATAKIIKWADMTYMPALFFLYALIFSGQ